MVNRSAGHSFVPARTQLGCRHVDGRTTFGVWAPHAERVIVCAERDHSSDDELGIEIDADRGDGGCWFASTDAARPGDRYWFRLHTADGVIERSDPRARAMTNSAGRSVIVEHRAWADDGFVPAGRNELVIYELHAKTFAGSLDDVADRLDHVAGLGVNAVEVMPLAEFAGEVSWGYNPAQPFAIEESYGGPDAMRRLVRRAHDLGLAVIVDVVYNHFGPSDLDLWRFDGWHEGDGGGIYFYNDWRADTPWGATRPDYGRDEVRQYIIDNGVMWIEEYGVDGLRLDSTCNIRNAHGHGGPDGDLEDGARLLRDLTDTIHAHHPHAILIAEDLQRDPTITVATEDGGYGFDLQWSAGFVHQIRAALENGDADAHPVLESLHTAAPFARVVYTESHDEVANGRTRVGASVDPDDPNGWLAHRRSAIGALLVMTVPDVPMLFQGQEWGDVQWFDDQDDVDWLTVGENSDTIVMWRDLISLRTGRDDRAPALRGDRLRMVRSEHGGVVAYLRWGLGGEDNSVLVVANLEGENVETRLDLEPGWLCVFDTTAPKYHHSGDHVVPSVSDESMLTISAHGAAIFARS